ncbi:MAG: DUF4115 domain-containing protein [Chloroflexi bacterium]|nr:DUF4115 domain-containing protein [Chloroflexota bacterium]
MPPVGDILREARECKGVTIAQASATTKIQERFLVAFEEEDRTSLPGGIYTKGLLTKYAEYLGLDPDEIVKMFGIAPSTRRRETITVEPVTKPMEPSAKFAPSFALVLFVVILAAALFAWSYSAFFAADSGSGTPAALVPSPTPTASATATSPSPAAEIGVLPTQTATPAVTQAATPTVTPTPSPTPSPTPTAATQIDLTIDALQPAWVLVRADGKQIANATIPGGMSTTYTAQQTISIWCGNSDYVEITINGQKMGRLGGPGQDIVKTAWALDNGKVVTANY